MNKFSFWHTTAATIAVLKEEAAADGSGDGRAAEEKSKRQNWRAPTEHHGSAPTEKIHQSDELIDCLYHRVSLLEKHQDEAVRSGADTEKQLCEDEEEPKSNDEEFVFVFRGSESCRALKKGPKEEVRLVKRKERLHDKDHEISRFDKDPLNRLKWLLSRSGGVLKDTRRRCVFQKRRELQERAFWNKQREQRWAVWPLWPWGVASSTVSTTERAEGDTPAKMQLLETRGEQEPAGDRWGTHSASGETSQSSLSPLDDHREI